MGKRGEATETSFIRNPFTTPDSRPIVHGRCPSSGEHVKSIGMSPPELKVAPVTQRMLREMEGRHQADGKIGGGQLYGRRVKKER